MPAAPDMAPVAQPGPAAILPDPADISDLRLARTPPEYLYGQTAAGKPMVPVRLAPLPSVIPSSIQRDEQMPEVPAPNAAGPPSKSFSVLTGGLRVSPVGSLTFETAGKK